MNKFIVTDFSVSQDYNIDYFDNNLKFKLELMPYVKDDDMSHTLRNISAGRLITILTDEYNEWFEPFADEFKQFLIDNYPDKIVKDSVGFKRIFGE